MVATADNLTKLLIASTSNVTQIKNLAKKIVVNTTTTAPPPPLNDFPLKSVKIQLPVFEGSAPLEWLFQTD